MQYQVIKAELIAYNQTFILTELSVLDVYSFFIQSFSSVRVISWSPDSCREFFPLVTCEFSPHSQCLSFSLIPDKLAKRENKTSRKICDVATDY